MHITTILPVSRVVYLDRILETLQNQTYKSQSLVVIFDGSNDDFIKVRNKVVGIDYQNVLCVKSTNRKPAISIYERRWHIANIHNQLRGIIGETDYIFSVEDDGILPTNALERLVGSKELVGLGMITGVELGRWGVPYVGAWRVDDVFDPRRIISMENHAGEDTGTSIDACGLYCALVKADLYKSHEFTASNGLGPDVNLGLHIRQAGFSNYIDWGIMVTHLTNRAGFEMEIPANDRSMIVVMQSLGNNSWHQTKYTGAMFPENTGQVPS